nr:hypothetical protein [Tanacetum cinerariifolium]
MESVRSLDKSELDARVLRLQGNDAGKTYVDLVSSSLYVPSVLGTANVVDLFYVPLNTLGDIDNLTKDIELGKYEDAFVAENPNVTSGYSSDQGKSDSLESRVKESLTMDVPFIEGSGFTIETVTIEYERKPPCCDLCKIFGHVHDHCPKTVSVFPFAVTHNAVTPTVEKTNDGFQTVSKKKKGKSKSANGGQGASKLGNAFKLSSMSKNQPLKAIVTSTKEGNITMSNSYAALDNESEEDVKNVYDESANLLHSLKTCRSSSTFTAVVG